MKKMTRPEMDARLSSSDLIRLDQIPGFKESLVSTTLRISQSGWAAFWIDSFIPATGQEPGFRELRFEEDEIATIRRLIDSLDEQPNDLGNWDDIGKRTIKCWRYDSEREYSIQEAPDLRTAQAFLGDPSFTELWNFVHRPFADLYPKTEAEP